MKLISLIVLLCFFLPLYSIAQVKNVLFIGNSMTYYNNMPFLLQNIAQSNGVDLTFQVHAPGGTGFVNHVVDNNLFSTIRNNSFDIVIMQPGTGESAGATHSTSATAQRGLQILDSIKKYNSCFKAFLYEIPYGVVNSNSYSNYFSVQTMIEDSVRQIADLMHIPMIPAGECQFAFYSQNPNLLLNNTYNDVHPSHNGSYLVASTMYASIFQDSISGTQFAPNIQPTNLSIFQQIVDSVVFTHSDLWRLDIFHQTSSFTYELESGTLSCFNTSQYYDSLLWELSNEIESNETSPVFSLTENGTYTISLTTFKNGCKLQSIQDINISTLNNNEKPIQNDLIIYPNPTEDFLFIKSDKMYSKIEIIDLNGKIILVKLIESVNDFLDLKMLDEGSYLLNIYEENFLVKSTLFNIN